MDRGKTTMAGILLLAFIGIIYIAFSFIQEMLYNYKRKTEPFASASNAITRPSDCRCLPGFIPSNGGGSNYFCKKLCSGDDRGCDPKETKKCY